MKIRTSYALVMLPAFLTFSPDHSAAQQRTENVVVAPVGETRQPGAITTRQQLDDQVRRFADRYHARMSIAVDRMRKHPLEPDQFQSAAYWRMMSRVSSIDIAIGPNAVTNLLDMMVLATLSRMVLEQYWVPERFGEEFGRPLAEAARAMEKDIWDTADAVLTPELQAEMRTMIENYYDQNPDQIHPWWIRMDRFSGQRAARLNAIRRSGGLLKEVRAARETAEEFQKYAERALFYTQRAPGIISGRMENSMLQILGGPQVTQILEDSNRFIDAVEQLVQAFEDLSVKRLAAIDQVMDGLSQQREALFNDFSTASPEARLMLGDLRAIVESTERVTATLNTGNKRSEAVDIAEYRALTADVTQAVIELTKLIDAVSGISDSPDDIVAIVDHLVAGQERVLNRLLIILLISIAFFFICLSGYRLVAAKTKRL